MPLADFAAGLRLLRGLPSFMRHPVEPLEARSALRRRLEGRAADFLALARLALQPATGPYRRLFASAGCELGDLERLVAADGVEGALERLLRDGVYLTVGEFKAVSRSCGARPGFNWTRPDCTIRSFADR
jgi:hypothetical protein